MVCIQKYYRIDPKNICFLRFIFEACDGAAVVTTVDPKTGIVVLIIPPGRMEEADLILQGIQEQIPIEALEPFLELTNQAGS